MIKVLMQFQIVCSAAGFVISATLTVYYMQLYVALWIFIHKCHKNCNERQL